MTMNLTQAFATYLPWIEDEIRAALTATDAAAARHYEIMQYHMGWRDPELRPVAMPAGKRIRPMLCLLACAAAGGDPRHAVPAAAGLELLHNFSLIHDDIEDKSTLRRHRPTAWVLFGMPIACNAGDGMLSAGHLAFFRSERYAVPAPRILTALWRFDETCLALTEGQFLDMSFEARQDVTPEDYTRMIAGKTGALLAAAPEIGAVIAGAPSEVAAAYRGYGAALGRAFQLQDDILGIWGDEAITGKSAASDILSKKKTLPVLLALADAVVGPRLRAVYARPTLTTDDVPGVLALLNEAGARAATQAAVRAATAEARAALIAAQASAETEAHTLLSDLLDSLVERNM